MQTEMILLAIRPLEKHVVFYGHFYIEICLQDNKHSNPTKLQSVIQKFL